MTPTNGFDLKSFHPVVATVFAEAQKHTPKEYDTLISDILHKAESGDEAFGAHTGSIMNVLNHNFSSVSSKSDKYMSALNLAFKSHDEEGKFKRIISRFSGIMKGGIPRINVAKPVGRKASGKKLATMR
jgi:hypothetical protein